MENFGFGQTQTFNTLWGCFLVNLKKQGIKPQFFHMFYTQKLDYGLFKRCYAVFYMLITPR